MSIHVGNRVYDIVDDTTGTVLEIKFDDFGEMGYDEKEVANAKHINFVQKIDSLKKICYE